MLFSSLSGLTYREQWLSMTWYNLKVDQCVMNISITSILAGYLQAVKKEVNLLHEMVKSLDAFSGQQSRLIIVVDGLDSVEQRKVLSVLDTVHTLFSDPGSPFIIVLAIDPHVITKVMSPYLSLCLTPEFQAIELNLNQVFSDTSIGGHAYLRNMVHLPFFLQNAGLRKVKMAQQVSNKLKSKYLWKLYPVKLALLFSVSFLD